MNEPPCLNCGGCCNQVKRDLWCTWCRTIFERQPDAWAHNGWRVRVWSRREMKP